MNNITFEDVNGKDGHAKISEKPDICPICRTKIVPVLLNACLREAALSLELELVYRCPNSNCSHLFIAYYSEQSRMSGYYILNHTRVPFYIEERKFSEIISSISKKFELIYNQAVIAEHIDLKEICGGGFRKSLEFLVKDYLIKDQPETTESIKTMDLAKAIKKITDENISVCAERAAWLGNDHAHYVIRWTDKNLSHLKDLIDLVVAWIESTEKTQKYKSEMKKS